MRRAYKVWLLALTVVLWVSSPVLAQVGKLTIVDNMGLIRLIAHVKSRVLIEVVFKNSGNNREVILKSLSGFYPNVIGKRIDDRRAVFTNVAPGKWLIGGEVSDNIYSLEVKEEE